MSNLLQKVANRRQLLNAWSKLDKSNPFSHGPSGVNFIQYKENLETKLESVGKRLREGSFAFRPVRAVCIPKSKKGFRPLRVPEIEDRIVLKSIALVVEEQLHSFLIESSHVSFAYQKKKGVRDAIEKIVEIYSEGYTIVLEADIINFFGTVNRQELLDTHLFPKLPDNSIDTLIAGALSQSVTGLDRLTATQQELFTASEEGIPQGNALSPLLSNLYLSPFDKELSAKEYRLVRYADDFVILTKSREEAVEAYHCCTNSLEKLDLSLYKLDGEDSKTRIINPSKDEFSFLSITFDGQDIYPEKAKVRKLEKDIKSTLQSCDNVLSAIQKTKNKLDGWLSAYFYTSIERYYDVIDDCIDLELYYALKKNKWKLTKPRTITTSRATGGGRTRKLSALSLEQRQKSGIPWCKEVVELRRGNEEVPRTT